MSPDTAGTTFNFTSRSASRSSVQCPYPSGGLPHASVTSLASASPSSTRLAGRGGCGRRSTAARTGSTPPSALPSANRRRTRSAVATLTPRAAAIASSVWPTPAFSRIRARVIFRADSRPVPTSRSNTSRCSSVSATTCFLAIRASFARRLSITPARPADELRQTTSARGH